LNHEPKTHRSIRIILLLPILFLRPKIDRAPGWRYRSPTSARSSYLTALWLGCGLAASLLLVRVVAGYLPSRSLAALSNSTFLPLVMTNQGGSASVFRGLLFGLGPEADQAVQSPLVLNSQAKILTCWFNRSADLSLFRYWYESGKIAGWWSRSYVLHVITWEQPTTDPPTPYHVSPKYVADMAQLAGYLAGPNDGRHVVLFSLATEFQTFVQPNNVHNSQTGGYYDRLQSNLLQARDRIKSFAANALVSFSWGGWQTRWDAPADGGGLSMIPFFAQTMQQMDFISFQAMERTYPVNVENIKCNCDVFRQYNPHLMVSHYKPDYIAGDPTSMQQARDTLNAEVKDIFTPSFISYVHDRGLFGFSFMSEELILTDQESQPIIDGMNTYTILP